MPLGPGLARAQHVAPAAPRVIVRWDGYQWEPQSVAQDLGATRRLLQPEGSGRAPDSGPSHRPSAKMLSNPSVPIYLCCRCAAKTGAVMDNSTLSYWCVTCLTQAIRDSSRPVLDFTPLTEEAERYEDLLRRSGLRT